MKKLIITSILMISMIVVINAQFTKIGGGLTLGSGFPVPKQDGNTIRSGLLGGTVKGIYEIKMPIHLSPSFSYFLHIKDDQIEKHKIASYLFDLNGHYVFNSLDRFEFYALAGLNITFVTMKEKWESEPHYSSPRYSNKIGLNLGAGAYMKLTEQFDLFCESKYILSGYDQFMLNVGVLLNLQWLSKHENPGI